MISPLSIERPWQLHWKRLPSNMKKLNYINDESPKECVALDAIAKIGMAGGRQISRLFSLQKKRLKRMEREQKIVRHELCLNKQIITLYTLGQVGAVITAVPYVPNYWVEYKLKDVLKRLMFFELYPYFPRSTIIPAPVPFTGAIQFQGKLFYIYVSRGDIKDLILHLKWKGAIKERVVIVAESLKHLRPLIMYGRGMKLRITTDEDLNAVGQNMFYLLNENGEFVKEG